MHGFPSFLVAQQWLVPKFCPVTFETRLFDLVLCTSMSDHSSGCKRTPRSGRASTSMRTCSHDERHVRPRHVRILAWAGPVPHVRVRQSDVRFHEVLSGSISGSKGVSIGFEREV